MESKFLKLDKPPLVAMVQESCPASAIAVIMNSHFEGAEAFGIQLCYLKREYRNEHTLSSIFKACRGKPIYVTSYRSHESADLTDDERAELLLLALKSGATLCDVMGDLFHAEENQFTFDSQAVKKQKALIERIHALGGEVLISTHLPQRLDDEGVMALARAQEERGADIVKIVNYSDTPEDDSSSLWLIERLKREISRPVLYLTRGDCCDLVRRIGAIHGSAMYLCVDRYLPVTAKAQPLLRSARAIRDNILF